MRRIAFLSAVLLAASACQLVIDPDDLVRPDGSGAQPGDASVVLPGSDASTEPGPDASTEPGPDASTEPGPDASTEPGPDAAVEPGTDAATTPEDAGFASDASGAGLDASGPGQDAGPVNQVCPSAITLFMGERFTFNILQGTYASSNGCSGQMSEMERNGSSVTMKAYSPGVCTLNLLDTAGTRLGWAEVTVVNAPGEVLTGKLQGSPNVPTFVLSSSPQTAARVAPDGTFAFYDVPVSPRASTDLRVVSDLDDNGSFCWQSDGISDSTVNASFDPGNGMWALGGTLTLPGINSRPVQAPEGFVVVHDQATDPNATTRRAGVMFSPMFFNGFAAANGIEVRALKNTLILARDTVGYARPSFTLLSPYESLTQFQVAWGSETNFSPAATFPTPTAGTKTVTVNLTIDPPAQSGDRIVVLMGRGLTGGIPEDMVLKTQDVSASTSSTSLTLNLLEPTAVAQSQGLPVSHVAAYRVAAFVDRGPVPNGQIDPSEPNNLGPRGPLTFFDARNNAVGIDLVAGRHRTLVTAEEQDGTYFVNVAALSGSGSVRGARALHDANGFDFTFDGGVAGMVRRFSTVKQQAPVAVDLLLADNQACNRERVDGTAIVPIANWSVTLPSGAAKDSGNFIFDKPANFAAEHFELVLQPVNGGGETLYEMAIDGATTYNLPFSAIAGGSLPTNTELLVRLRAVDARGNALVRTGRFTLCKAACFQTNNTCETDYATCSGACGTCPAGFGTCGGGLSPDHCGPAWRSADLPMTGAESVTHAAAIRGASGDNAIAVVGSDGSGIGFLYDCTIVAGVADCTKALGGTGTPKMRWVSPDLINGGGVAAGESSSTYWSSAGDREWNPVTMSGLTAAEMPSSIASAGGYVAITAPGVVFFPGSSTRMSETGFSPGAVWATLSKEVWVADLGSAVMRKCSQTGGCTTDPGSPAVGARRVFGEGISVAVWDGANALYVNPSGILGNWVSYPVNLGGFATAATDLWAQHLSDPAGPDIFAAVFNSTSSALCSSVNCECVGVVRSLGTVAEVDGVFCRKDAAGGDLGEIVTLDGLSGEMLWALTSHGRAHYRP